MDGEWHRVPVVGGKKRQSEGSYKGVLPHDSLTGKANGYIKNFRNPDLSGSWYAKKNHQYVLTSSDRERIEREHAQRMIQEAAAYETVSVLCQSIYNNAADVNPAHKYLSEKDVKAYGLKQSGNRLLIPVCDVNGKMTSLQYIMPSGFKRFEQGGRKVGSFHMIGDASRSAVIGIVEGYATGATIHEATGIPIAVAFDSGNLKEVSCALRKANPEMNLFIFSDDDRFEKTSISYDKENGKVMPGSLVPNVGRIYAAKAAEKAKAAVIYPKFADNDWKGTDFNDLAKWSGKDEVKRQVERGISRALQRKEIER